MKTCAKCQSSFEITDWDKNFYAKVGIPEPKMCPRCRMVRRLQDRNARNLYKRVCNFTGKTMISQHHADTPFPVYSVDAWWSDKWDAMDHGQDFDFSRPFFEQFQELKNKVPHIGQYVIGGTLENSDYTNCTGYIKDCYLIFEADYDEKCFYGNNIYHSNSCAEVAYVTKCELCYECTDCTDCYNLKYSQDCQNCNDSYFLKNCLGCTDSIGCINQVRKKYMIFNKQYTKEEYEKKKVEMRLDTYSGVENLRKQCAEFFSDKIHKNLQGEHNENSFGDHLYNSKNSTFCFDSKDVEDSKYCVKVFNGVKDCMDYNSWGFGAELIYQSSSCGDNIYNIKFCTTCTTNFSNSEYCQQCTSSDYLFGCFGLKKKEYCILNKQYTKEEYFELKEKIIEHMKNTGEWGEYWPQSMCHFGYNETLALSLIHI